MKRFTINQSVCISCAGCASVCPVMAVRIDENGSVVTDRCIRCGRCRDFCPLDAVEEEKGPAHA